MPLALPDGVPEFLVEGFQSVSISSGTAKLNMFAVQASPDGTGGRPTLICRLAFSLPALVATHQALSRLMSDLQRDGHLMFEGDQNGN